MTANRPQGPFDQVNFLPELIEALHCLTCARQHADCSGASQIPFAIITDDRCAQVMRTD
ncbi:hypothetical protein [Pseudomonas sp. JZ134]|uniref:hypothetical protein n=1 Tax=Pseudomonas sp. JZ134 TaxID=2806615 RepID=UPI003D9FCE84